MTANEKYKEAKDLACALSDWFQSQEVSPAQSIGAMAIVIGALCASHADDIFDLLEGLYKTQVLINSQAFTSLEKLGKLKLEREPK